MSKFDGSGMLINSQTMEDLRKKLEFEAWLRCNKQADFIYHRCMTELSPSNKEWNCSVEKHQDHVFCMHHEKDMIKQTLQTIKQEQLTVHVANVGTAGNTTTNPSIGSNLRN